MIPALKTEGETISQLKNRGREIPKFVPLNICVLKNENTSGEIEKHTPHENKKESTAPSNIWITTKPPNSLFEQPISLFIFELKN